MTEFIENEQGRTSLDFNEAEIFWEQILSQPFSDENSLFTMEEKMQEKEYDSKEFEIDDNLSSKIMKMGKNNDIAIYVILLAVYEILLYKISGESTQAVIAPTTKNGDSGYNKFVVHRTTIDKKDTFRKILDDIKWQVVDGYKYQFYPIRKIVNKKSEQYVNRLFQFSIIYNSIHKNEQFRNIMTDYSNQLILKVTKGEKNFLCEIEYRKESVQSYVMDGFINAYLRILNQVIYNVDLRIHELEVVTVAERERLVKDFNLTEEKECTYGSIVEEFEKSVEKYPNHVCLKFVDRIDDNLKYTTMSYTEVNKKANQIARMLIEQGVKRNDVVAVLMTPSIEMHVVIIGILKAGAGYLPLSFAYPPNRIKYSILDSSSRLVITNTSDFEDENLNINVIDINNIDFTKYDTSNLKLCIYPSNTAYIIYTSGTTGKPKGVQINQGNIINTLKFRRKLHGLTEVDVVLQLFSHVFDGFVASFFTPLISGCEIIILSQKLISDIRALKEIISQNGVSHFGTIPHLYREMLEEQEGNEFQKVKSIVLAGEKVAWEIVQTSIVRNKSTKIVIEYGVSECSVLSTYLVCNEEIISGTYIGRPIANNRVYVLNEDNNVLPMGFVGELCVAGVGVSKKGYLNNYKLTNNKFINVTFDRIYKTGDLVRWNSNGLLEYVGRKDDQVKIRGYRIELGDIEKQLLSHSSIKDVVLTIKKISMKKGTLNDKYLCAYYILKNSEKKITNIELRNFLREKLPEYMIPSFFEEIDKFPLNSNGKIDFDKLPIPSFENGITREKPENAIEKKLVEIWSELLNIDSKVIWKDSNFFELGGHSLNVTKLISKLRKEFKSNLSITDIYEKSTIREISKLISENLDNERRITNVTEKEFYRTSSEQRRMYFINEIDNNEKAYHISSVYCLKGKVDLKAMEAAFKIVIENNETLRTSFHNINGEIMQKVHTTEDINFQINYIDMSGASINIINKEIEKSIKPFIVHKPCLMNITLVKSAEDIFYLVIDLHHIIADGLSLKILVEEFVDTYSGKSIKKKNIQYKDYVQWKEENEISKEKQKKFWVEEFLGEIPLLQLPTDFERPAIKRFRGKKYSLLLNKDRFIDLEALANRLRVSLFTIVFTIYNIFLYKVTGNNTNVVGFPTLGRKYVEIERTVGMFANTIACKNTIDSQISFEELVHIINEKIKKCIENEEYLYEELVSELKMTRDISRNPLFDTMLNYEDIQIPEISMGNVNVFPYHIEKTSAKFDLTLNCCNYQSTLKFEMEYDTDLFKESTVKNFMRYFTKIVDDICENNAILIRDINILPKEEIQYFLNEYNETTAEYPFDKTIIDLFDEQVQRDGKSIAVRDREKSYSYKELQVYSNQLANKLIIEGYKKGDVIGIYIEKSVELIISILALMKIGATYIPIGKEYTLQQIEFVISNSNMKLLLIDNKNVSNIFNRNSVKTYSMDQFVKYEGALFSPEFDNIGKPEDCVYIIYTSGTTGEPKGVEIFNYSLTNYVIWAKKNYTFIDSKNFPLFTSISFDLTVTSIFTPLISGGAIIIYNDLNIITRLESILENEEIKIIKLTPSHLKYLCELQIQKIYIRRIIVGGEKFPIKLAQKLYEKFDGKVDIINEYGPTEATVGCMIYHYNYENDNKYISVPIGKPADNTKLYVLDSDNNLVPKGVKGELYIAGVGVAKGYLNDMENNKNKFVPCKYNKGIMYKTGDFVCFNEEGNLLFLGRKDRQIKLNGYRIELSEIEDMLIKIEGINDVAATTIEKKDLSLIIFLVLKSTTKVEDIKKAIYERLPNYIAVNKFVFLEKFPLTKNGKIDFEQLLRYTDEEEIDIDLNISNIAEIIKSIWSLVLGIEDAPINQNFFELGGDSMKAIKLKKQLEETLKLEIPIVAIFQYPEIGRFTEYIQQLLNLAPGGQDYIEDDIDELRLIKANFGTSMEDDDE